MRPLLLVLLLSGCTPAAHRDGENVLLFCTFPCLLFYRTGLATIGKQECPMIEKVAR